MGTRFVLGLPILTSIKNVKKLNENFNTTSQKESQILKNEEIIKKKLEKNAKNLFFKEEQLSQIEKNLLKNKNDLALKEQQLNQKAQELAKKAENLSKKEQELAKNISEIPKISNIDESLSTVSSYANIDTDNQELASIRKEDEFVLNEKSVDILDINNGTFKDKGNRANSKQSSVVNEIDAQYAPPVFYSLAIKKIVKGLMGPLFWR